MGGGGGSWLETVPDRFTPGEETLYPLYRRLGGPQGQKGQGVGTVTPTALTGGVRTPTGAARYNHYTIAASPKWTQAIL
jgi:hypothetical protein